MKRTMAARIAAVWKTWITDIISAFKLCPAAVCKCFDLSLVLLPHRLDYLLKAIGTFSQGRRTPCRPLNHPRRAVEWPLGPLSPVGPLAALLDSL